MKQHSRKRQPAPCDLHHTIPAQHSLSVISIVDNLESTEPSLFFLFMKSLSSTPFQRFNVQSTAVVLSALVLFGCGGGAPVALPTATEVVPSNALFGIHGIGFDRDNNLLVGSVVSESIYVIDRETGAATTLVGAPLGQADDITTGADGSIYYTGFSQGNIYRRYPNGRVRTIASNLPGINSLDIHEGRLFATQVFLGDALYEISPTGDEPPRKIIEGMGGLNGFEIHSNGKLYGPLWFKGQIARVNLDTGELDVVAENFKIPAALNFGPDGKMYVVDTAEGAVYRIDTRYSRKKIASLPTAIDNLGFDLKGELYVTVMADNAVWHVDRITGATREITSSQLAIPNGLASTRDGLYIADGFSVRKLDNEGQVQDIARVFGTDMLDYSVGGVALHKGTLYSTTGHSGNVQSIELATGKVRRIYQLGGDPIDVLPFSDTSLLVLLQAAGMVIELNLQDGTSNVLISGLNQPQGMVRLSTRTVAISHLSPEGEGQIVRGYLDRGGVEVLSTAVSRPEGIAIDPSGNLYIADGAASQVVRLNPISGRATPVFTVPLGSDFGSAATGGGVRSAVAWHNGRVYVSSDQNGGLYAYDVLASEEESE